MLIATAIFCNAVIFGSVAIPFANFNTAKQIATVCGCSHKMIQ